MMLWMPEKSYQGKLPPLKTAEITPQRLLQQDLKKLAVKIGIRNTSQYEKLNQIKDLLITYLTQSDYEIQQQEYKIDGKFYYNIEVEKKGINKPEEIIVVGDHYDSAFTSPERISNELWCKDSGLS